MSKTLLEKMKSRQYRELIISSELQENKRIDTDYYVEGYAAKFEPYPLFEYAGETIYEKFEKGCFAKTDMEDIIFQYNHSGRVFARKSNGTLIVEVDDTGLFIAADLSKSKDGRNLHEEIQNGLTTKMSWGFVPGDYYFDEKTKTITHQTIKKIYDVSAVSLAANDDTEIYARDFFSGVIKGSNEECVRRENQIKKLELIIKLNTGDKR